MKRFLVRFTVVGSVLALALKLIVRTISFRNEPCSDIYGEVDDCVQRQMDRLHIPGVSLAIVEGDKIVHLRGFGLARLRGGVSNILVLAHL